MPAPKKFASVYGSVNSVDAERLKELSEAQGKSSSLIVREALEWYLDNQATLDRDQKESALERRLKKMEDRLAALQVKTALDIGMVFMLMYRNMDLKERDKSVAWAYNGAVKRLRKKVSDEAIDLIEKVKGE